MVLVLFVVDTSCIWCGDDDDGVVDIPILFDGLLVCSCGKYIVTAGSYDVDVDGVVDDVGADNNLMLASMKLVVDDSLMLIVRVGIWGCTEMCEDQMRVLGKYGIYQWLLWTKPHIPWRE